MSRLLAILALLTPVAAGAQPVVAELFTSQSCSSCPPADALLIELARDPDVLALDLHVDYWNGLGWRDPFSSPSFTARQKRYASLLAQDGVYTPELVVGGRQGVVGSDRAAVMAVLAAAKARPQVPLRLGREGATLVAEVGAGQGPAALWLVGYDARKETHVGGGENGGRTLVEANVVRSISPAASWSGEPLRAVLAVPEGERAAAFLQAEDGAIIAAATVP